MHLFSCILSSNLASGAECVGNLTRRDEPRTEPLGCLAFNSNLTDDSLSGLTDIGFPDPYIDRDKVLMDPGLCIIFCANYLFSYAALTKGNECRCGSQDGLKSYKPTSSLNCNVSCVGNASYSCGGKGTYTVYTAILSQNKIPASGMPPINKKLTIINNLKNDANFLGCIKDSPYCGVRTLDGIQKETNSMTVDICIDYCRRSNYRYAGLEIGTQCFCGNSYDSISSLSLEDCSSCCVGNGSQICGGSLSLSIYGVIPSPNTNSTSTTLSVGAITGIIIGAIIAIVTVGLVFHIIKNYVCVAKGECCEDAHEVRNNWCF